MIRTPTLQAATGLIIQRTDLRYQRARSLRQQRITTMQELTAELVRSGLRLERATQRLRETIK